MKKLLLIDGHSLIHRAYHAYPKTLATKAGELTNAVYGFTNILLTAIGEIKPTHVAVAFDLPGPTFRETLFVGYKRSREKPEDELLAQIPQVKEVVAALNIPICEIAGFEADDVIGTLAKQGTRAKPSSRAVRPRAHCRGAQVFDSETQAFVPRTQPRGTRGAEGGQGLRENQISAQVIILTSDRDLMQLIDDDRVVIALPAKGKVPAKTWDEQLFRAEWGFEPVLLPDYKAFAGDQSDDIPGVAGIGENTAKKLVSRFGHVNAVYQSLEGVRDQLGEAVAKKLVNGQEDAQLSKQLATIDCNAPIQLSWDNTAIHEYDKEKVLSLFEQLEFNSLLKKLPDDSFEQSIQEVLF